MAETKHKVLLIDDEKFLLEIYSIKFHKRGFDVFVCSSADEGIAALERGYDPDAILFDITMPHKTGYEFLEEITRLGLGKRALKIALTNQSRPGETERTHELGADAHLIKAKYTAGELVDLVTNMIENRN